MIRVNFKAAYHYFIIYLLIISQGSVLFNNHKDFLTVLYTVMSISYIFRRNLFRYPDKEILHIYFIILGLMATMLLSWGGLSVFSAGSLIGRLLLAYLAVNFDGKKFPQRYVNTVVFLSVLSLMLYGIQLYSMNLIRSVLPASQQINGVCYGGILATASESHIVRNCGLATEPGRHQIYVIPALFFLLFRTDYFDYTSRHNMTCRLILMLAILTAQSTTGYFALSILLIAFGLDSLRLRTEKERALSRRMYILLILLSIAAAVYISMNAEENFFKVTISDKIFDRDGNLNIARSSGGARIASMKTDLILALKHPSGLGYDPYLQKWSYLIRRTNHPLERSSCVGLTITCAALGFHVAILILWYYYAEARKNCKDKIEMLILCMLLLNSALAQPDLCYAPMMVMFLVNGQRQSAAQTGIDKGRYRWKIGK